jgi:D-tyrosyl-tRNA(Tyr) deacylase
LKALVQRVSQAAVDVEGERVAQIGPGMLVLLGVSKDDGEEAVDRLADKVAKLRIFDDADGRMNEPLGERQILCVSQFTLYGDVRHGKSPSFDASAPPEKARSLYEYFVERIRAAGLRCETGKFQEMMEVELVNDGPVTILLDSSKAF